MGWERAIKPRTWGGTGKSAGRMRLRLAGKEFWPWLTHPTLLPSGHMAARHPAGPTQPPHQDLGEDVPSVLAFSLQPQRAQRLLQPRRRARPRGSFRESWGNARARRDTVGGRGARGLWVEGSSGTLQGRGACVSAWREVQAGR